MSDYQESEMKIKPDSMTNSPSPLTGALVGLVTTPALIALFFIGSQFAGLPFVPFDLFDWIARTLPGDVVTFGIDTMVDTLIALGFGSDLDSTAKLAERTMALGIFMLTGIVFSTIVFLVFNRLRASNSYLPGIIAGLILGAPLMAISFDVNIAATASDALNLIWMLLLFGGFGTTVGWIYNELRSIGVRQQIQHDDAAPAASATALDRRQFIVRVGGASATLTVFGTGVGTFLSNTFSDGGGEIPRVASGDAAPIPATGSGDALPNAGDPVTPAPGTRLEYTPVENHYRIDIVSGGLPSFDEDTYTLPITGLVANEVEWSLDDIKNMPAMSEYITMSCISNRIAGSLISTTKWTGVSFQHILEQLQPSENAVALKITGADDFDEFVSLDLIRQDERIMLTYYFDDAPLPQRNGYPLRIHIPDRYGMKQPKWITKIEVVDEMGDGYWVRRGWSEEARVNATSVIDTVATDSLYREDSAWMVPVGGMAWAGDRGISKVEVRVDGGDWQEARLRTPLSGRAWTIWRYDWAFEEGQHDFEVRCYEGDGTMQVLSERGVRPDGATGIHSLRETLRQPEDGEAQQETS